ncbi:PspC domain-containing protein [Mycoplasmatota bacterium zrk1]
MEKRLYRNRSEAKLAGVCAGFAEYFDIDVTLIRILWVVAVFGAGTGILLYIIFALVLPVKESSTL